MFILDTDQPPATTAELIRAITASLKRSIDLSTANDPVQIGGNLPDLESIAVDVSNSDVIASQSLPDRDQLNDTLPGPTSKSIAILGNPVRIATIPVQLSLAAKEIRFNYGHADSGQIIAIPDQASDGRLTIKLAQSAMDNALLLLAKKFTARQSVEILKVQTTLNSASPTDLNVLIKITAKKFMTAVVDISGQIEIDDRMRITGSKLKASSSGIAGNVAVGLLQPQLNKLEGRPLPLLNFSLGKMKLRGVAIDTTDGLALTASFGSEPS